MSVKVSTSTSALVVDLRPCDQRKLADAEYLRKLLDTLGKEVGVYAPMDPFLFVYQYEYDPGPAGYTGVLHLRDGSRIFMQTFPYRRWASFGIFSEHKINRESVESLLRDLLMEESDISGTTQNRL